MLKLTENLLRKLQRLIKNLGIMCVQNFSLCLESKQENSPAENTALSTLPSQAKIDAEESKFPGTILKIIFGF
jgi:hypothetical protein